LLLPALSPTSLLADGKNDYLGPICVGIKNIDYFTVYNRWKQLVFTYKDMRGKWNGNFNGT
jgi:hypothetical protein